MTGLAACILVFVAMFKAGDPEFYELLAAAAVFALLDIADAIRAATKARRRERETANR
jgi:hypothetical protein